MAIESDRAEALSGVRHGVTTGAPDRAADSEQGLGELAAHDGTSSRQPPADATGVDRAGGDASAARPRRSRRRREVRPRRHPQRARARQRARNGGARRRRRRSPGSCSQQLGADDRQPRRRRSGPRRIADPLAVTFERGAGDSAGLAAALRRRGRRAADDRGDRSRARGRRHDGRQLRSDRARRAARARQLRAVGPQARWTARAGADVDSGDQGGRHRPRPGRRRLPGSRIHDEILPLAGATAHPAASA